MASEVRSGGHVAPANARIARGGARPPHRVYATIRDDVGWGFASPPVALAEGQEEDKDGCLKVWQCC